ncbi:hypothetical protein [Enterovibrio coralii]|uniref:Uncharacterized protein n=1 Tax=Enterovibrio coralii TaxID=294935 RepID=A0A135I8R8_9GAMM|nr:hypothetical protein [Enterovibrio coralii]KXF81852.1 hypothetical protein ATN88_20370 [Enterovibrio coralii]
MSIIDAHTLNTFLSLPDLTTFRQLATPAASLMEHEIRESNLDDAALDYDIFDLKPSLTHPASRLTNISRPNMGKRTVSVNNSAELQDGMSQLLRSLTPVKEQLNSLVAVDHFIFQASGYCAIPFTTMSTMIKAGCCLTMLMKVPLHWYLLALFLM